MLQRRIMLASALSDDRLDLGEGSDAVLLLHGFSGSPFELRPLAEGLARAGFRCSIPRLPHGGDFTSLASTGEADWMAAAHDELDRLREESGGKVFVVGFSAGACMALRMAAERPGDLAALALLAPALSLRGNARLFRHLFRSRFLARRIPEVSKGRMDVRDQTGRREVPYLDRLPTAAALPLHRLIEEARKALPQVRTPALVLWGEKDTVVPRSAVVHAAKKIGSGPARLAIFPRSAHQLALDGEREAVAAEVARFFQIFVRARSGDG